MAEITIIGGISHFFSGAIGGFIGYKIGRKQQAEDTEREDPVEKERREINLRMKLDRMDHEHEQRMEERKKEEEVLREEIEEIRESLKKIKQPEQFK